MRRLVGLVLCGLSCGLSGCIIGDIGREMTKGTMDTFRPTARGYRDEANGDGEFVDNFSQVGREGRGDTALDHQSDRLTPYWSSSKAQAIERNLGYD